ncbi:hypothetical protein RB195_008237 [Necator americanus]|uniref:Nuclear pore complex protein Nup98-Nup96 n=1 Tax=Necator americanus TaxID=51031 RepID=A0ABR1CMM6_NECAM
MFGKSTFGSTGSTFGSSGGSLFGQNKPTTNLFGQQNSPAQGSLFGQKSTTNLFGQNTASTGTSIFGSSQPASNTGTSLFGQSKPSLFGSSSASGGGSLFGSSATSAGGGLFGSATSSVNGTTVKFEPLISSDTMMKNGSQTTISTKHMCITAMKAYEGKSLEELRIDDYIANRKAPTAGGGLFGSSTTSAAGTSIFGSTSSAKPSLFGSSSATTSPFGSSNQGTSLFGQNNNATQGSSLFGSKPTGSIFGSPATSSASTFGSTGGSLFGNTAGASTFSSNPQTTSLFGGSTFGSVPTTTSAFSFGSTTNTTSSPFGQTATSSTGGLFGSNTTTSTGSLFGKPAGTSNFTFGGSSNTTFGQAASGGGLFGSTQKPGGLFGGNTNATGSIFGSQNSQQGTGLFGSNQTAQPSLFASSTGNQQGTTVAGFGATAPTTIQVPAAAPIVLGSDVNQAQVQMALLDAQIAASPYGDSPLLKLANVKDTDELPNPISAQRQLKFLAAKSAASSPLNISATNRIAGSPSLDGSLINVKSSFLPVVPPKVADTGISSPGIRTSVMPGRDLNYTSHVAPPTLGKGIRTKSLNSTTSMASRSLNGSLINKTVDSAIETSLTGVANKPPNSGRRGNLKHLDLSTVVQVINSRDNFEVDRGPRDPDELPTTTDVAALENNGTYSPETDPRTGVLQRGEARRAREEVPRLVLDGSACEDSLLISSKSTASTAKTTTSVTSAAFAEVAASPRVVTSSTSKPIVQLNSPDYFTEPTINAMKEMVVNGKVILNNGLTVGRATYGSVFWPGRIELEDVTLDEIVVFRHKEVTVYPDESKKPPLGEGLNRPAEVTLERVWHVDRATKEEVRDPLKLIDLGWRDRLEKVTARMGATFKDYRPSTGSWVFRVEHFSKYGLPDDDDEGDVDVASNGKKPSAPQETSAHEMDVSIEEHQLQSHVQRAKVFQIRGASVREQEDVSSDFGEPNVGPPTVELKQVKGLGGRKNEDYDNESSYDDYDIANWRDEVPEKKPKIEDVLDYVYEESKRLLELSTMSTRPVHRINLKCTEPANIFRGGVEARKGIGYRKSRVMNIASASGSSCRISWSQGGQFAFIVQPNSTEARICTLQYDSNVPKQLIVDMLEHNVRLSRSIRRNSSTSARVRHYEIEGQTTAPRVKPAEDSSAQLLDSFLATATQSECTVQERIWKLCRALFPADKTGSWQWQRTHDVGNWLREEVASLSKKNIGSIASATQIWSLLCTGNAEEAVRVAAEGGMILLSVIISTTLSTEQIGRQDCANMVEMWEMNGDLGTMDDDLIKVYLVLAGKSHTELRRKGKTIKLNCLEGLDWRQAFGIHLWWINRGSFLEDAIESFSNDVTAGRAASPESHVFEQLIKLACSPSHQIEAVLDAAAMLTPNPLDAHLSWHLWSLLRALGHHTMSPAAEQRLHMLYAAQLTATELWHLAIFVLSHISHDQCRSIAIREVLDRMSFTASSQDYEKILAICDVPTTWISAAKFMKAKAQGNLEAACSHALSACNYVAALRLFADDVAPNAIAMGDLLRLRTIAENMEKSADKIAGWGAIGQIYADYCMLRMMDDEDDTQENEERLHQFLESISARIQAPIFKTPIQRLCMKTMARELFEIQKLAGKTDINLPLSELIDCNSTHTFMILTIRSVVNTSNRHGLLHNIAHSQMSTTCQQSDHILTPPLVVPPVFPSLLNTWSNPTVTYSRITVEDLLGINTTHSNRMSMQTSLNPLACPFQPGFLHPLFFQSCKGSRQAQPSNHTGKANGQLIKPTPVPPSVNPGSSQNQPSNAYVSRGTTYFGQLYCSSNIPEKLDNSLAPYSVQEEPYHLNSPKFQRDIAKMIWEIEDLYDNALKVIRQRRMEWKKERKTRIARKTGPPSSSSSSFSIKRENTGPTKNDNGAVDVDSVIRDILTHSSKKSYEKNEELGKKPFVYLMRDRHSKFFVEHIESEDPCQEEKSTDEEKNQVPKKILRFVEQTFTGKELTVEEIADAILKVEVNVDEENDDCLKPTKETMVNVIERVQRYIIDELKLDPVKFISVRLHSASTTTKLLLKAQGKSFSGTRNIRRLRLEGILQIQAVEKEKPDDIKRMKHGILTYDGKQVTVAAIVKALAKLVHEIYGRTLPFKISKSGLSSFVARKKANILKALEMDSFVSDMQNQTYAAGYRTLRIEIPNNIVLNRKRKRKIKPIFVRRKQSSMDNKVINLKENEENERSFLSADIQRNVDIALEPNKVLIEPIKKVVFKESLEIEDLTQSEGESQDKFPSIISTKANNPFLSRRNNVAGKIELHKNKNTRNPLTPRSYRTVSRRINIIKSSPKKLRKTIMKIMSPKKKDESLNEKRSFDRIGNNGALNNVHALADYLSLRGRLTAAPTSIVIRTIEKKAKKRNKKGWRKSWI